MQIGWIELLEYRNYHTLKYTPSPRLNILAGPNGQGKTNLLEAVGVLLTGRSFRTHRLVEILRWGADAAHVSGELRRADATRTVRRAISRASEGGVSRAGESCPWARAIAFSWQDLEIVHGAPGPRRDFIDGFAGRLYPSHRGTLGRFRQILARRNLVLQSGRRAADDAVLASWDEQLARVGMELIDRRRRAAAALQGELARVYLALSGGGEKVELRYRSSLGETSDPADYVAALERARPQEFRRGQTLVGPHRDDLTIEIDGIEARAYASRGQQRLLALALRLAEILPVTEAAGTAPVLLLDDALSELDARVREHALREIAHAEQVFLTTPEVLTVPGAAQWSVNGEEVVAA